MFFVWLRPNQTLCFVWFGHVWLFDLPKPWNNATKEQCNTFCKKGISFGHIFYEMKIRQPVPRLKMNFSLICKFSAHLWPSHIRCFCVISPKSNTLFCLIWTCLICPNRETMQQKKTMQHFAWREFQVPLSPKTLKWETLKNSNSILSFSRIWKFEI